MSLPTEELIIWANTDVNLPELSGPNKTKPIDDLIDKGWDFKQKPAADEFNYILNNLGMHISYLEQNKTYTFAGDVSGTATTVGSDNVTFNISVTDNSHNHTSSNISDATNLNNPSTIVKRSASGGITIGTLTLDKVDSISKIIFPAENNDAGFIKHIESPADVGKMQFSIGDNNVSTDIFEFGYTNDGTFIPTLSIKANGELDVPSGAIGNATTATTLQNSRTINGTSFNGSTNITTNSWGTSRTLTLAGAVTGSVSINGSGDATLNTSVSSTSGVSILTGTVANGGTIPLPSGYSESQCRWLVSVNNDNPSNTAWDWQEGVSSDHIHSYCSANGTRVVTCYRTVLSEAGSQTHNGTANYIIIGVK